jgi:hypothetical protein
MLKLTRLKGGHHGDDKGSNQWLHDSYLVRLGQLDY